MKDQHPFYFLSAAFVYPEQDNIKSISEVLNSLASDMGMDNVPQDTLNIPFEDLQAEYVRLFINSPGGVAAPPYASIYIHNSGLLLQQGHDQALAFYRKAGLEPVESNEYGDHLSHELAFVGRLFDKNDDELLCEFLEEHLLKWYPDFLQRLLAANPCPFYSLLGQVTDLCLKHMKEKEEVAHE